MQSNTLNSISFDNQSHDPNLPFIPVKGMVLYKSKGQNYGYIEVFDISQNHDNSYQAHGFQPAKIRFVEELYNGCQEILASQPVNKNSGVNYSINIDEDAAKKLIEFNHGKTLVRWLYKTDEKRDIKISGEIKQCWIPPIEFHVVGEELYVKALIDDEYYKLPFPNIHHDSNMCTGSNETPRYEKFVKLSDFMKYYEEMFFLGGFNEYHRSEQQHARQLQIMIQSNTQPEWTALLDFE